MSNVTWSIILSELGVGFTQHTWSNQTCAALLYSILTGCCCWIQCGFLFSIWTATCASWPSSSRKPASTWSGTGPRSSGSAWCRGQMSVNLTVRYEICSANEICFLGCLFVCVCDYNHLTLDDCSGGTKALQTVDIQALLSFITVPKAGTSTCCKFRWLK